MPITGISSMATRRVLTDLADAYQRQSGTQVAIESVGGLDAARRVAAGEPFDIVVLARRAVDELAAAGHLEPSTRIDLARSHVAIAVPAGAPRPGLGSEQAVRDAVLAARSIARRKTVDRFMMGLGVADDLGCGRQGSMPWRRFVASAAGAAK